MKSAYILLTFAQTVTIDPVGAVTVVEGNNLIINCTDGVTTGLGLILRENSRQLIDDDTPPNEVNGAVRVFQFPVDRAKDGNTYECLQVLTAVTSSQITLTVIYPPVYSLLPNRPTTVLEGGDFTYRFGFEAKPTPSNFTWSRDGQVISSGTRITTSVSTITIASTTRSDSGVYEVVSYNEAGRGAANFTLDVQYPPEYANTAPVHHTQFLVGSPFTLNCTPSAANPPVDTVSIEVDRSPVTTGDTVTVTDNVITIPLVQRSHSGNYSCNATNTRGSAVIYNNFLVIAPPGRPENLAFPSIGPYSATVTWSPPSDNGGTLAPLTYMVALTTSSGGQSVASSQTTQTRLTFTALFHSENYTASVVAVNGHGQQGLPLVGTFRTRDIPPVIGTVATEALSLSEVQVTVTLSDSGGQPVEEYTVEVRGTNYTFPSSEQMQVSLLLIQLSVNLTKGERFTLRTFAVNSVGTSDPVSADVIVPFPPNITAPPTELDPANIPVCCAGVQLNLQNPEDPIDVRVLVDDTLHPVDQVVRNDSFLYIMGLQAGTEYSLNITLSNILGAVQTNTTVRPLLGSPSTPLVALTPTAGGLTVQLSAMYPGTREDTLQYSISTSASPRSRRQTGQQTLSVTDLTTPVSGSAEVSLGPGTYSVTVTVTNQHGSTTSEPQQVTIPGPAGVDTAVIIGVVVAIAIVIILIILSVIFIALVCMKCNNTIRCCKLGLSYDDVQVELKGVHSHFEDVKLEPNPAYGEVSPSKAPTEPQPYEEFVAIGGMTSGGDVAMEANPVYQPTEPQLYEECIGGVTSKDVAMEENPAYQPADTTASQTGEPVYL